MKAYLVTTGSIFGLIVLAHILRIIEEGQHLARDPLLHPPHRRGRRHVCLGFATVPQALEAVKQLQGCRRNSCTGKK